MDYNIVSCHCGLQRVCVANIAQDKLNVIPTDKTRPVYPAGGTKGVVEHIGGHFVVSLKQGLNDVGADEPFGTGHKNSHAQHSLRISNT
jgi:hypothetical protein